MCSRTVSRSARIWHGWNSSVSALTTGHRACCGHLLDPVLAVGAPHDRGRPAGRAPARCRRSTRARRSGRGCRRRPAGGRRARRCRPRRRPGCAGGGLSKMHRDGLRARPAAVRVSGSALSSTAAVSTSRLLGRAEVVVAQEVARVMAAPSVRRQVRGVAIEEPGSDRDEGVDLPLDVMTSGGAMRMASRGDGVDDEPGLAGRRPRLRRRRAASTIARSRPAPAHRRRPAGWSSAATAAARWSPDRAWRGASRPSLLDRVEDGEAGGGRERVAAERRAVLPGLRAARTTSAPKVTQRADRHPAAEPLGQRDGVGHDPGLPGRRTSRRCGRCRSGSRRRRAARRARVVISRAAREVAGVGRDDAGLALDRLEDDRARSSSSTAARAPSASPYGTM